MSERENRLDRMLRTTEAATVRLSAMREEQEERADALVARLAAVEAERDYANQSLAEFVARHLRDGELLDAMRAERDEAHAALREIVEFLDGYGDDDPGYVMSNVRRIVRAALASDKEKNE